MVFLHFSLKSLAKYLCEIIYLSQMKRSCVNHTKLKQLEQKAYTIVIQYFNSKVYLESMNNHAFMMQQLIKHLPNEQKYKSTFQIIQKVNQNEFAILLNLYIYHTNQKLLYLLRMSTQMNPEKDNGSHHRSSTLQNKNNHEKASFCDKLKEIKTIITNIVPQDKQRELFNHLQELNDLYLIENKQLKLKQQKGKTSISEVEGKYKQIDSNKEKVRKSEKFILEVREGNQIVNGLKIETQPKMKSPQKKVQEKKFMKFEPKKSAKPEAAAIFGNIMKNGPHI